MPMQARNQGAAPRQVCLVAIPEATASTLFGLHDVLSAPTLMGWAQADIAPRAPFDVEIVGVEAGELRLASGVTVTAGRSIRDMKSPDVVIVPSILLRQAWRKGQYPAIVDWLRHVHERGALLASACSGIFLLGETGLFDGRDVTVHFGYAPALAQAYPSMRIQEQHALVVTGDREELVSSGASTSWHDLALYLIARYSGPTLCHEVARLFALQWHQEGLTPYLTFDPPTHHGDTQISQIQRWLEKNFAVANPVEEATRCSRLPARTFKRRFAQATGMTPIAYVHRLRIEDAKRRLERTGNSVEEISWRVGYEDAAFFRRLFKRVTGLSPAQYRKRFLVPEPARLRPTDAGGLRT